MRNFITPHVTTVHGRKNLSAPTLIWYARLTRYQPLSDQSGPTNRRPRQGPVCPAWLHIDWALWWHCVPPGTRAISFLHIILKPNLPLFNARSNQPAGNEAVVVWLRSVCVRWISNLDGIKIRSFTFGLAGFGPLLRGALLLHVAFDLSAAVAGPAPYASCKSIGFCGFLHDHKGALLPSVGAYPAPLCPCAGIVWQG